MQVQSGGWGGKSGQSGSGSGAKVRALGSSDASCALNPLLAPPLRYALASHFFWGLWSILQASMSTIEFGYLVSNPDGRVRWGRGGAGVWCAPGQLWADWGLWVLAPNLLTSVWGGFPPQEYAQSRFQFYFQQKGQLTSFHPPS